MRNAALEKKVNIPEFGTITKREFMDRAKVAGWTVEAKLMDGYQAGRFRRTKYNRLAGDEQTKYEESMSTKKMDYSIYIPNTRLSYDISKTEYEYFQSLEYVKIGGMEL